MGIIRKRSFGVLSAAQAETIDILDSPERLLDFARRKDIGTLPLDVEKLAEEMKINIERKQLGEDLSGCLQKDIDSGHWKITVNAVHHPNRQRYTIAHEIGHYCLHRFYSNFFEDEIFFRGGEGTKTEWQANDFAAEILMPEDVFREKVRGGTKEVAKLAEIFEVSSLAIRLRAKKLGMTGHGL